MRTATTATSSLALGLAFATSLLQGSETKPASKPAPTPAPTDTHVRQYIGTDKCRVCHMKKSIGEQYQIWKKVKHSSAFATLATPAAKEIAKKMGIADAQKSDKCLRCHVTAPDAKPAELAATFKRSEGVGCEACHGAAGDYFIEEIHGKGWDEGMKEGLLLPDEKTCLSCHNKDSPTYKEFNFEKARKVIDHPRPEKKDGK